MKKYFFILWSIFVSFPVFAQTDIITDVFTTLGSDYINKIDNKDIMLKGLNSITKIDNFIKFNHTDKNVIMYYASKHAETFALPSNTDLPHVWSDFTKSIINKAIETSPKVELIDFEIPDRFAQEVFDDLDGYSHYYSAFSEQADKPHIIRRNFASRVVDDNILLIKISIFKKDIYQKVQTAIDECSKCKGIILDLRGNHGGLLDEALKITDMFLDEGIVTYTLSKNQSKPKFYTAKEGDIFDNKPMVILVDGFSASASEILAASLSEQNRAVLIGTKTYGKGTVQDISKNQNGSAVALTTSYFYTPGGNIIDKKGIMPAICTGGLNSAHSINDANCERQDRFTNETDVEIAAKFIKNEL